MMRNIPEFPDFKSLELDDQDVINRYLHAWPSQASDYTFTNMFIWRDYYHVQWSIAGDWLIILYNPMYWGYYFLQPVGPPGRKQITLKILHWLRDQKDEPEPRIDRGDAVFAEELENDPQLEIETVRDQFDYVYNTEDLIQLTGRKFHGKKNHVNKFRKSYTFEYTTLTELMANECIHVLKKWCNWRECEKNLIMRAEFEAVYQALIHFSQLHISGGLIRINNTVEAFAMGEMLNEQTAIIHVEKANPDIPGSFAIINQQFAEQQWLKTVYINREQDLGVEGLRKAKMSYNPHHMVEKFRVRLKK